MFIFSFLCSTIYAIIRERAGSDAKINVHLTYGSRPHVLYANEGTTDNSCILMEHCYCCLGCVAGSFLHTLRAQEHARLCSWGDLLFGGMRNATQHLCLTCEGIILVVSFHHLCSLLLRVVRYDAASCRPFAAASPSLLTIKQGTLLYNTCDFHVSLRSSESAPRKKSSVQDE
jgi:hypothetical protein